MILRGNQNVDVINLQQAEPLDDAPEIVGAGATPRSRTIEALRRESDAARILEREVVAGHGRAIRRLSQSADRRPMETGGSYGSYISYRAAFAPLGVDVPPFAGTSRAMRSGSLNAM